MAHTYTKNLLVVYVNSNLIGHPVCYVASLIQVELENGVGLGPSIFGLG